MKNLRSAGLFSGIKNEYLKVRIMCTKMCIERRSEASAVITTRPYTLVFKVDPEFKFQDTDGMKLSSQYILSDPLPLEMGVTAILPQEISLESVDIVGVISGGAQVSDSLVDPEKYGYTREELVKLVTSINMSIPREAVINVSASYYDVEADLFMSFVTTKNHPI